MATVNFHLGFSDEGWITIAVRPMAKAACIPLSYFWLQCLSDLFVTCTWLMAKVAYIGSKFCIAAFPGIFV